MSNVRHAHVKKLILPAVSLLILLTACQSTPPAANGPSVGTVVAQTLEALTAAAPTPVSVSYNNVSFDLPPELNASVGLSTSDTVEFPYINPSNGPMPQHAIFSFTNSSLPGSGRIMVFKASEYAAYSGSLQEKVTAVLAGQDTVQPLPDALVDGHFYAQAKPVDFKNGHGVRYLLQSMDAPVPINNDGLFYYYQGITTDGAYFVSATFDVHAAFLAANSSPDAVIPPDGVPFNGPGVNYDTYLKAIVQKLNDTPADSFVPSLLTLDKTIESLQVAAP